MRESLGECDLIRRQRTARVTGVKSRDHLLTRSHIAREPLSAICHISQNPRTTTGNGQLESEAWEKITADVKHSIQVIGGILRNIAVLLDDTEVPGDGEAS